MGRTTYMRREPSLLAVARSTDLMLAAFSNQHTFALARASEREGRGRKQGEDRRVLHGSSMDIHGICFDEPLLPSSMTANSLAAALPNEFAVVGTNIRGVRQKIFHVHRAVVEHSPILSLPPSPSLSLSFSLSLSLSLSPCIVLPTSFDLRVGTAIAACEELFIV